MSCQSCWIFLVSLLAFGLSVYAIYIQSQVEKATEEDEDYEALCDINEQFSCSKLYASQYGKGFGLDFLPEDLRLPNGVYGAGLYFVLSLLSECWNWNNYWFWDYWHFNPFSGFSKFLNIVKIQLFLSLQSIFISIYLAYVSLFVIKVFCLVCIALYVLNIVNTVLIAQKHNRLFTTDVPIVIDEEKEKEE